MKPDRSISGALEHQLELWMRLATAIEQAQSALLNGDVGEFERSTEVQADCCRQYEALRIPDSSKHAPVPNAVDGPLLEKIEQARQRVRRLNRTHAALLLRASRSLRILKNLLSGSEAPYAPPAALRCAPMLLESE